MAKQRRQHTLEFKREAVRLVREGESRLHSLWERHPGQSCEAPLPGLLQEVAGLLEPGVRGALLPHLWRAISVARPVCRSCFKAS